ncbi:MAG: PIN domain-containing protein [Thermoanaerobaculia bacterium]|nr:PIN domain-containing protein [Thermoanaerobaculia bacterium]
MALLVDTGAVYALADADDAWHHRVRDFLTSKGEMLLVPVTVLPEITYLLERRLGSAVERRFVASLVAGELFVEPLETADLGRIAEVLERYPQIGFVDASVVAMAERLGAAGVVTTDRRHFSMVRPRHRDAFELWP